MFITAIDDEFMGFCTMQSLESDYPEVRFPENFLVPSNTSLADYNCYVCEPLPCPSSDSRSQRLISKTPELVAGKWVQGWDIVTIPENRRVPDWVNFNIDLLKNSGYKAWAKAIKKANSDDELFYQNLTISVGITNVEAAQAYYDLIVSKPSQAVRDAINVLAIKYNIGIVF